MSRDVFPYPDDKALITSFLLGNIAPDHTETLAKVPTGLAVIIAGDEPIVSNYFTVAWFDTGGALVFSLNDSRAYGTVALALNEICKQLGMPARVTREARETVQFGRTIGTMHYFIDDEAVAPNTPVVILDGLGMRAWRAATTVGQTP